MFKFFRIFLLLFLLISVVNCATKKAVNSNPVISESTINPTKDKNIEDDQEKDSNILVEEFMLLANIAVAHRIYDKYPTKSILRRHPQPNTKQLEQLGECIKSYGFDCDISSSSSIQVNK